MVLRPLQMNDQDLLQNSDIREFPFANMCNPPECRISEVRDLPPRGLLIWTVEIYFRTSGFGCSEVHNITNL
jgi:hypothetical protein